MLNKYGKLLALFFALTLINSLDSFVSYYFLTKDDKSILLLGDYHSGIDEINELHAKSFINTLNNLGTKFDINKFDKIPFIVELHESIIRKMSESKSCVVAKTFSCFIQYISQNKNKTIIDFDYYDPRSEQESDIINDVLRNFEKYINENNHQTKYAEFIDRLQEARYGSSVTVGSYLKSLDLGLQMLRNWAEKYREDIFGHEFQNAIETIEESIEQAKEYFKNEELSTPLAITLINIISLEENLKGALDKYSKLINLLLVKLDYVIADLGFLDSILENQQKHNKLLFLGGNAHVEFLANVLQKNGYVLKDKENALRCNVTKIDLDILDKIPETLDICLKIFLDPTSPNQDQLLKKCFWCQKEDNLSACARCKNAFYCSRECQKSHWLWHKNICKAK